MIIKSKVLSDISVSTAQAIINQLSGIVVFFILSKYLSKNSLGHINWALAVFMVSFAILGFGLEHLAVKKAATGNDPALLLQSYMAHVLISGILFIMLVWFMQTTVPVLQQDGQLFLLLAISQCLSFFATPFRQITSGLERFRALFIMSSSANIIKVLLLLVLVLLHEISLSLIIEIYLFAAFAELVICVIMYKMIVGLPIIVAYSRKRHIAFLKEALPQLGITLFNTAVARVDWILLGILSTAVIVAEYSFTNKLFELATLPLLIIAPVIFPRIAKLFNGEKDSLQQNKMSYLGVLVRIEIIVAVFVALCMNLCWVSIIDPLTANKYGNATKQIVFIMSFAMPLVYINNICWSILFARAEMRTLLCIFLLTFMINISADLVFIPIYHGVGAALGFVLALATQLLFYFTKVNVTEVKKAVFHLFPILVIALVSGFASINLFDFFIWQILVACTGYFLLLWICKQLKLEDWMMIKKLIINSPS